MVGPFWPSGIGFSIFTCEGIGLIIPIKEVIRKKEDFTKVMIVAVGCYAVLCIAYAEYALFSFGAEKSQWPLVTESMPRKSPITWTVKIFLCVELIITATLMLHPASTVIDSNTTA